MCMSVCVCERERERETVRESLSSWKMQTYWLRKGEENECLHAMQTNVSFWIQEYSLSLIFFLHTHPIYIYIYIHIYNCSGVKLFINNLRTLCHLGRSQGISEEKIPPHWHHVLVEDALSFCHCLVCWTLMFDKMPKTITHRRWIDQNGDFFADLPGDYEYIDWHWRTQSHT